MSISGGSKPDMTVSQCSREKENGNGYDMSDVAFTSLCRSLYVQIIIFNVWLCVSRLPIEELADRQTDRWRDGRTEPTKGLV